MKLSRDLFFIDMEFNAQEDPHEVFEDEIIQVGLVYINRRFEESSIQTFSSLIQIPRPLTPFIQNLTNISQDQMTQAVPLQELLPVIKMWIKSLSTNAVLCGWGNDGKHFKDVAGVHSIDLECKAWNVKPIAEFMSGLYCRGSVKKTGLVSIMQAWGLEWDFRYGKQHDALADAWNTMRLFQAFDAHTQKIRSSINNLQKIV